MTLSDEDKVWISNQIREERTYFAEMIPSWLSTEFYNLRSLLFTNLTNEEALIFEDEFPNENKNANDRFINFSTLFDNFTTDENGAVINFTYIKHKLLYLQEQIDSLDLSGGDVDLTPTNNNINAKATLLLNAINATKQAIEDKDCCPTFNEYEQVTIDAQPWYNSPKTYHGLAPLSVGEIKSSWRKFQFNYGDPEVIVYSNPLDEVNYEWQGSEINIYDGNNQLIGTLSKHGDHSPFCALESYTTKFEPYIDPNNPPDENKLECEYFNKLLININNLSREIRSMKKLDSENSNCDLTPVLNDIKTKTDLIIAEIENNIREGTFLSSPDFEPVLKKQFVADVYLSIDWEVIGGTKRYSDRIVLNPNLELDWDDLWENKLKPLTWKHGNIHAYVPAKKTSKNICGGYFSSVDEARKVLETLSSLSTIEKVSNDDCVRLGYGANKTKYNTHDTHIAKLTCYSIKQDKVLFMFTRDKGRLQLI